MDAETGVWPQCFQASKLASLGAVAPGPTRTSDGQTEISSGHARLLLLCADNVGDSFFSDHPPDF